MLFVWRNVIREYLIKEIKMSYVNPDYKSKKEFKQAVENGKIHYTYNPSGLFETTKDGTDAKEMKILD